jgi:hypothetical protein
MSSWCRPVPESAPRVEDPPVGRQLKDGQQRVDWVAEQYGSCGLLLTDCWAKSALQTFKKGWSPLIVVRCMTRRYLDSSS